MYTREGVKFSTMIKYRRDGFEQKGAGCNGNVMELKIESWVQTFTLALTPYVSSDGSQILHLWVFILFVKCG